MLVSLRHAVALYAVLLVGCASPSHDVVVSVRVTGAITRDGSYAHRADEQHYCGEYRVYPAPAIPAAVAQPHLPTQWEVSFNERSSLPDPRFRLLAELNPPEAPLPAPHAGLITTTAGGRVWSSFRQGEPLAWSKIEAEPYRIAGTFRFEGLMPEDGGPERINVEGRWRCPARR